MSHSTKKTQNLETKLTPVTEPHPSSENFARKRFRGHKTWFLKGWMRLQIPFTYAEKKPLYSIPIFKKYRFFSSSQKVRLLISSSPCPLYSCKNQRKGTGKAETTKNVSWKGEWEVTPGRYDLFTLWHTNQLEIQEDTKMKNLEESAISRLPQKINLELFSISRTMNYQIYGTFLGTAEKGKHDILHSNARHQPHLADKPSQLTENIISLKCS